MHYSGPVVRPPHEDNSVLLEVTVGCTHNSCRFCTFYRGTAFKIAPMEQIEADLQEVSRLYPDAPRVYAVGGDPFTLSVKRLEDIAILIGQYLPKANIAMYARITSIKNKSVEDLKKLRSLGINDIVIGIESGDDEVLKKVNKGYTASEILRECKKLELAGIEYRVIYLGGLAGHGKGEQNALRTAQVLNQLNPTFMYLTTITIQNDSALYQDILQGKFEEASEFERIQEFRTLVQHLEKKIVIDARIAYNPVHFKISLPEEKKTFLERIYKTIANFTDEDEVVLRNHRSQFDTV